MSRAATCRCAAEGAKRSRRPYRVLVRESPLWEEETGLRLRLRQSGASSLRLATADEENPLRLIYPRAVQEANQEGVLWTPLLDRLASQGNGPRVPGKIDREGRRVLVSPGGREKRVQALLPWLERQCTAAPWMELAAFERRHGRTAANGGR